MKNVSYPISRAGFLLRTGISTHPYYQYLFAALASLAVIFLVTSLWKVNLHYPFAYAADSISSETVIKTIIDTGWNNTNPYLGLPGHYDMADYPIAEGFHYLLIRVLALFTHDPSLILNIFYILSFPLVTATSLFVMQRIGLNYILALTASILFAMAPYHFSRFEYHLFLSSYYTIPLSTWLALLIADQEMKFSKKEAILYVVIAVLIGSSGVYYAYFASFFIFIAGLIAVCKSKKAKCFYPAAVLVSIIVAAGAINVAPSIIHKLKNPPNPEALIRHQSDSENYGLNIMKLLLPSEDNRLTNLSKLNQHFYKSSVLPADSGEVKRLGLYASIGFLLLLFLLLFESQFLNEKIRNLTKFNIFAVLLGTIGGFGTLIAYTISPMIRCYGRISIFIAFFSLTALFYLIQQLIEKFPRLNNLYFMLVLAPILLLSGWVTQNGFHFRNHRIDGNQPSIIREFDSDREFVQKIEQILPANSMVFQLPYTRFPEYTTVYNMTDYELLKAYLHSQHLRWSYGAMAGEAADHWQKEVSGLPTPLLVNQLVHSGFEGIYINRKGYPDNADQLEEQLTSILKSNPIQSRNGDLIFYDLRSYRGNLQQEKEGT